jgi:hypothetical protein
MSAKTLFATVNRLPDDMTDPGVVAGISDTVAFASRRRLAIDDTIGIFRDQQPNLHHLIRRCTVVTAPSFKCNGTGSPTR